MMITSCANYRWPSICVSIRCVRMDWNTVESRAGSTGMCLSDRPLMFHADVTQAHNLQ